MGIIWKERYVFLLGGFLQYQITAVLRLQLEGKPARSEGGRFFPALVVCVLHAIPACCVVGAFAWPTFALPGGREQMGD